MPAATGIGSHSDKIYGYLVATKNIDYENLENSIQMSAYRYPPQYGPKSPSFARATIKKNLKKDGSVQVFISGTASIRGHQTLHEGDIEKQVNTTMENIEHLISHENISKQGFDFPSNTVTSN